MDRTTAPHPRTDPLLSRTPMGSRILALDWSGHPLGAPESWPDTLRTALAAMLEAPFPMHLEWGGDHFLFYNDAYAPVMGARDPWALGRPFREVWPEIWDEVSHLLSGAMAGESTFAEDVPLVVQRNGRPERLNFTYSCSPVRGPDGEPAGVLNVVSETTDRVRARGVLGNMGEAYVALDADLRIVDANAEALRLDGRGARGLLGSTLFEAYPDAAGGPLGEAVRGVAGSRVPRTVEHRFRWRGGREGWVETRAYPTDDGLALFLRDVDERRRREDDLAEAETRLRALADNLPGGVAYQVAVPADNSSRKFIYLSAGFEALAGKPASEALADPEAIYGMMPSPYREAVAAAEEVNVREMRPFDGSVPFVRPDGSTFWGRILAAPGGCPTDPSSSTASCSTRPPAGTRRNACARARPSSRPSRIPSTTWSGRPHRTVGSTTTTSVGTTSTAGSPVPWTARDGRRWSTRTTSPGPRRGGGNPL